MKKNVLIAVISIIIVIFVFSTGLWIGINFDSLKGYLSNTERNDTSAAADEFNLDTFEEVMDLISGNSLVEKSDEAIIRAGMEGILSALDDKYAEYFTAEEYSQIMEAYSGTTSGIGVVVTLNEEEQVLVIRILEDTPAYRAGIMEGDIIVEVDGTEIKDMDLEKIVAMIKGKEGTSVNLKIFRPSEDKTLEIGVTRAKFYIPNLISDIFEEDIGYIWYYDFQSNGAAQLDREIQKLIDDGASGLILDLRNNLGGTWDDAIEVCDLFINEGVISTIKGRTEDKESADEFIAREGKYTEIPLVVLINGYSASASELVAGALKDSGRAILVGERSYGKGVIQGLYELSDGSGIKFTTAKYFLPSGASVEGIGVRPDIIIELEEADTEDVQLNRAIEEINILISEIE
ncbi:MAG TPA: S41 family peptidase [Candidatus Humimicrobiaceae bacterium]